MIRFRLSAAKFDEMACKLRIQFHERLDMTGGTLDWAEMPDRRKAKYRNAITMVAGELGFEIELLPDQAPNAPAPVQTSGLFDEEKP